MTHTKFQDLSRDFYNIDLTNIADDFDILEYRLSKSSSAPGARLSMSMAIRQGSDFSRIEVGSNIVFRLYGAVHSMVVSDMSKSFTTSSMTVSITCVDEFFFIARRTPPRPIRYMSLTDKDLARFLYEQELDNKGNLDFVLRREVDLGQGFSRGWRLSTIVKELCDLINVRVFLSVQDHWVKDFEISGSIFDGVRSLVDKYKLDIRFLSNSFSTGGGNGTLIIADDSSQSPINTGTTFSPIDKATSVSVSESVLSSPSIVEFVGGSGEFSIAHYEGVSVQNKTFFQSDVLFGEVGAFISHRVFDKPDATDPAPADVAAMPPLSVGGDIIPGWSHGFQLEPNGPTGMTRISSNNLFIDTSDATDLGISNIDANFTTKTSDSSNTSADQQVQSLNRTVEHTWYANTFFADLGPAVKRVKFTVAESVLANPGSLGADGSLIPPIPANFVADFEMEVTNYGESIHPNFAAPRYYSPMLVDEKKGVKFLNKLNLQMFSSDVTSTGNPNFTKEKRFAHLNQDQDWEFTSIGRHLPYRIALKVGNVITFDSKDVRHFKIMPKEVTLDYIWYADEFEGEHLEGDILREMTRRFEPVFVNADNDVFSLVGEAADNSTVSKGKILPVSYGNYAQGQDWKQLLEISNLVEEVITEYAPIPNTGTASSGYTSFKKRVRTRKLNAGALEYGYFDETLVGKVPNARLSERLMPVEVAEPVRGSTASTIEKYGIRLYDNPIVQVADSTVTVREDANRIAKVLARRFSENTRSWSITFNKIVPVETGWVMRLKDIEAAEFDGKKEVHSPEETRGIVTSFNIIKTSGGATTTITVESI